MKFIVRCLSDEILKQTPHEQGKAIIRIDGFEDLRIYEQLCTLLKAKCDSIGVKLIAKISCDKFKDFKEKDYSGYQSEIQSMQNNNWVDKDDHLTKYRNMLPEANERLLVLLMGTEVVQDKGGLDDFFALNHNRLENIIDGRYHEVFGHMDWSDEEAECIDRLYSYLFELVPVNLYRLSSLADEWVDVNSIETFVERFFSSLPKWGLPKMGLDIPTPGKIIRSKKNILSPVYDFIQRNQFKKMTARQFNSNISRIQKYEMDCKAFSSNWDGWNNQAITRYESFSTVLEEFMLGKDIDANRQKLLGVDYAIPADVLGLKLETDPKTKQTVEKLHGMPLSAMLQALFIAFTSWDVETQSEACEVVFSFNRAGLVDAVDPTEDGTPDEQLEQKWRSLCIGIGGVINYINKRNWELGRKSIGITCSPSNFLSPQDAYTHIENNLITALGTSQSLNKIQFSIILRDGLGNGLGKKKDFEWVFLNNEGWVSAFSDVAYGFAGVLNDNMSQFVPLGTMKDIRQIINMKSDNEFFDALECADIKYTTDLLLLTTNKAANSNGAIWAAEYSNLGHTFVEFCRSISEKGFYEDISSVPDSKLDKLVNKYIAIGEKMTVANLPENMKWVLTIFIHAFCIEENDLPVTTEEETDCCIIPPWHPAVLQKMKDQMVFILDGCEQWWNRCCLEGKDVKKTDILDILSELEQLSWIHEGIDIFPTKGRQYFGNLSAFGGYCICGTTSVSGAIRSRDVLKKEAVFDDDFDDKEFTKIDAGARMIYDVISDYVKAFPNAADTMSLVFVDPTDLQPLVAALHRFIAEKKKDNRRIVDASKRVSLKVNILVRPENRGGRNYLSYWIDTFFSQDEDIDIRIFLNEWTKHDDVRKHVDDTVDIVFLMDVLKVDNLNFAPIIGGNNQPCVSDCFYPMVFKPTPASKTSVKRRIELTQTQFRASTVHSQAVYYHNNSVFEHDKEWMVVREVCIDKARQDLIYLLHQKAFWVVCIDGGMDGALLKNDADRQGDYKVIGFSTGKGPHGQYNLTITARNAIIEEVRKRFENRLKHMFQWAPEQLAAAAAICIKQASKLDGISLLSALNPDDYKINEFMAYVLTSLQVQENKIDTALRTVIDLDSYRHWFSDADNKSRPDFLYLTANSGQDGKVEIKATVIECKIARLHNAEEHKLKAVLQTQHGIKVLSERFDPQSKSVRRRFWFAQLYRALAFSQITFSDDSEEFGQLSAQLRTILDGNFTIHWDGRVMGYWVDMPGENIVFENSDLRIDICSVPQKVIQKLLLGSSENANIEFVADVGPISEEESEGVVSEANEDLDVNLDFGVGSVEDLGKNAHQNSYEVNTGTNKQSGDEADQEAKGESEGTGGSQPVTEEKDTSKTTMAGKSTHIPAAEGKTRAIEEVRVLIGPDRAGNNIFWDFGHKSLSNRHLLITGRSGQGKTYAIQTMLQELSLQGISCVVFDYTEGFRMDQMEEEFKETLEDKITQRIVYVQGIPINPFRQQEIDIGGMFITEKVVDVAQRIANIFTHVYKFGEQQYAAIYEACRIGIEKHSDNMDLAKLREELSTLNTNPAKTVLSKLAPFLDRDIFDVKGNFDWNQVTHSEGTVTIFQLTNFVREIQVIITEMMLWDAWHYNKKYGNKNTPFVVVLDEAQNLSHKANSPSAMILTEGRKFGWSAWFATQFMKAQLSDDEINRLQQAAVRVYFKPTDDELNSVAKQLDPTSQGVSMWLNNLKNLQKGQCIVAGERLKTGGVFGPAAPVVTNVASFSDREKIK
jgi:hypothetical protein